MHPNPLLTGLLLGSTLTLVQVSQAEPTPNADPVLAAPTEARVASDSVTGAATDALWPIPSQPPAIMNTLSTLQFYGPRPGFHHGLDLAVPGGTEVVAPVSGVVGTRYYYRRKSDYTYEVSITTDEGQRWELHHMKPSTVPAEVEALAERGGRIEAGSLVGAVFDASSMGITPHLHINVIEGEDRYLEPRRFLPAVDDRDPPSIRELFFAKADGEGLVEVAPEPGADAGMLLIIDTFDTAPGGVAKQSVHVLRVLRDGEPVHELRFDELPEPGFLTGADAVYVTGPIARLDGGVLAPEVRDLANRRFLYRVDIDPLDGPTTFTVESADFSGNGVAETLTVGG
jgi:hypothetical protein